MAQTEVWYPENAQVYVYDHQEKDVATGTIDSVGSSFVLSTNPSAVFGSYFNTNGSAQTQYVDANGSFARRDIQVYARKNGADTIWNTSSDGSIIAINGSELVFETAPTTEQADNIVATYAYNKSEKSDEVLSVSESGGERPVEFIQVYSGKQIKVSRTQQPFSVDVEILKGDLSFAEIVNGHQVTESIAGSGSVYTVTGASTRANRTIIVDGVDPETTNRMILAYWNVSGTTKSLDGPAEENYTETVTFQSKAEDKTEIYWEL